MRHFVFNSRIIALFMLTMLIVCLAAVFLYSSFDRIKEQQSWVTHTYEVIREINTVTLNLKIVQSAQRGYLMTGQREYLDSANEARPSIQITLDKLAKLIADNPRQIAREAHLQRLVNNRIETGDKVLNLYERTGQESAFAMIRSGDGRQQVGQIVALSDEMITEEELLLDKRQKAMDDAIRNTLRLGGLGLLLCFGLLATAFRQIYREVARRAQTEASLQLSLQQLQQLSEENQRTNRMAEFFQSCKTSHEAFEIIAANMPQLLPHSFGAISVFSNSRNVVEVKLRWGSKHCDHTEFHPDDCWALRRGRLHHVVVGGSEPHCSHVKCHPDGAYLCIPMQAQGETIGLFFVGVDDVIDLDDHKRQLARNLSEQISLALTNLRLQEKLRQQSIRDPMTNLFNRRYMEETLVREISRANLDDQPLSVVMLDIDHFKRFNDSFGHEAGDVLLMQFSQLLLTKVRAEDIACRYGGEEFLVILPGLDEQAAKDWAESLRLDVEQMHAELNGVALGRVTISVGISVLPHHGDTPEHLIHHADHALYKAKQSGRNQTMIWHDNIQSIG